MRPSDLYVFASCAWIVVEVRDDEKVKLRLLAGPESEPRTQVVPARMLAGRPIYRQVSALDDIDLDRAREEIGTGVNVDMYADDPRKWTEAFTQAYGSRPTPDGTIMLGWFANAIDAGMKSGRKKLGNRRKPRAAAMVKKPPPAKKASQPQTRKPVSKKRKSP